MSIFQHGEENHSESKEIRILIWFETHFLNISESGTPSGLRGTFNELACGKVSFFQNDRENHLESNESRNIGFDLLSEDEFCAILSQNEHRDDPEQVV